MRRHELDVASLIAGLVFVAISVAYLVGAFTDVRISSGWVLPLALIGLGAAGLAGSLRRGLRNDEAGQPADVELATVLDEPASARIDPAPAGQESSSTSGAPDASTPSRSDEPPTT